MYSVLSTKGRILRKNGNIIMLSIIWKSFHTHIWNHYFSFVIISVCGKSLWKFSVDFVVQKTFRNLQLVMRSPSSLAGWHTHTQTMLWILTERIRIFCWRSCCCCGKDDEKVLWVLSRKKKKLIYHTNLYLKNHIRLAYIELLLLLLWGSF